jgi:ribonuclease HI
MENTKNGYKDRNICILSDSQTAIKARNNFQIDSTLVCDCHQSLLKLAEHKRVQLVWVLGDIGIDGNKVADQLAREGSSHPLIGMHFEYL